MMEGRRAIANNVVNTAILSPQLQNLHASTVSSSRSTSPNPVSRASASGLAAALDVSINSHGTRFHSPTARSVASGATISSPHLPQRRSKTENGATTIRGRPPAGLAAASAAASVAASLAGDSDAEPWPAPLPLASVPLMSYLAGDPPTAADVAAVGYDLELVDQYLALLTGKHHPPGSRVGPLGPGMPKGSLEQYKTGAGRSFPNLQELGLDPSALHRMNVAPHHINRLYKSLAANAAAFAQTVVTEQSRLATLMQGGSEVPLPDRLLAYMFGAQAQLTQKDTDQEALGAGTSGALGVEASTATPLGTTRHARFETPAAVGATTSAGPSPSHRSNAAATVDASVGPVAAVTATTATTTTDLFADLGPSVVEEGQEGRPKMTTLHGKGGLVVSEEDRAALLSPEVVMDVDRATEVARSGNTVGLYRLLMQYRASYQLAREALLRRIEHEAARAGRAQDSLEEQAQVLRGMEGEKHDLTGMYLQQAEAIRALETRVAEMHEELAAQSAVEDSLREELAAMEAHWEAQLAEASARVTEQLEALQRQADGQTDLREQYLGKVKEVVALQLQLDSEVRRGVRLAADLSASREAVARTTRELQRVHSGVGRAERRADAAVGLANAGEAQVYDAAYQLSKEKADHKRTKAELGRVLHRVEQARCEAADVQSQAVKHIAYLTQALHEMTTRASRLEKQLHEAQEVAKVRTFEADSAKAFKKAAKEQLERTIVEQKATESRLIAKEEELVVLRQKVDELQTELAEVTEQQTAVTQQLEAVSAEVEHKERRLEAVVEYEKEREGAMAKIAHMEEKVATLQFNLSVLDGKHTALQGVKEQLAQREGDLEQLQGKYQRLGEAHQDLEATHQATLAGLTAANGRIRDLKVDLDQHIQLVETKNASLQQATDKLTEAEHALGRERDQVVLTSTELGVTKQLLQQAQDSVTELRQEVVTLKLLEQVITDREADIAELKAKLESSEQARCDALADREWWTQARQHLNLEMQELLSFSAAESTALQAMFDAAQEKLDALQAQMLGLGDNAPDGPDSLAAQDNALARGLASDLQALMQRLSVLLKNEETIKDGIEHQVQRLQHTMPDRLSSANQYWQSCLEAARLSPDSLSSYMIETANMRLDPLSPLASLVPVGLLEQQCQEIGGLKQAMGRVRGEREGALAQCQALEDTLVAERRAADERDKRYVALVASLRANIESLNAELKGHIAARQMHERLSEQLGKRLQDAEWAVSKAKEREATVGLTVGSKVALVPQGRVSRGVQTVYSELWVQAPPNTWGEASRRAMTPGVSSWGGDIGSGSVALPPLSTISGAWGGVMSQVASSCPSPTMGRSTSPPKAGFGGSKPLHTPGSRSGQRYPALHGSRPSTSPAFPPRPLGPLPSSPWAPPSPGTAMDSRPLSAWSWTPATPQGAPGAFMPTAGDPAAGFSPSHGPAPSGTPAEGMPQALWNVVLSGAEFQKLEQQQDDAVMVEMSYNWTWDWVREVDGLIAAAGIGAGGGRDGADEGGQGDQEGDASAGAGAGASGGASSLPLLSVAETLDVITTIYMNKVQDDAASTQEGVLPRSLRQYVGWYFMAAYRLGSDEAVRALAQFAASVRAHKGVYEVQVFGRHVGLLAPPGPKSSAQGQRSGSSDGSPADSIGGAGGTPPSPSRVGGATAAAAAAAAIRRTQDLAATAAAAAAAPAAAATPLRGGGSGRSSNVIPLGAGLDALATPASRSGPRVVPSLRASTPLLSPGSPSGLSLPSSPQHLKQGMSTPAAGTGTAAARAASGLGPRARSGGAAGPSPASPNPTSPRHGLDHPGSAAPLTGRPSAGLRASTPPGAVGVGPWDQGRPPPTPPTFAELAFSPMLGQAGASAVAVEAKALPVMDVRYLVTPELSQSLDQLLSTPGMDSLMRLMASGQFASQLFMPDLGTPLREALAPELHFLLQEASRCLGLDICPDLLEAPVLATWPEGPDRPSAALLQLPHSLAALSGAGTATGSGATGAKTGGGKNAAKAGAKGGHKLGWKRYATLLLRPGLMAEMRPLEVQAVLASALAPMCLPGGGGWRLDLGTSAAPARPSTSATPGTAAADAGIAADTLASPGGWRAEAATPGLVGPGALPGVGAAAPAPKVALADVVTAANLGDLMPEALVNQLPRQQQVKWERLHQPLRALHASAQATCDRAALLVVQQLGPVLRTIFKTVTGVSEEQCPEADILEQEARAFAASNDGMLDALAAAALSRMAALCQWHDSGEYQALLTRSGTTLRQLVDAKPRAAA